jgi:hypothetical protein
MESIFDIMSYINSYWFVLLILFVFIIFIGFAIQIFNKKDKSF